VAPAAQPAESQEIPSTPQRKLVRSIDRQNSFAEEARQLHCLTTGTKDREMRSSVKQMVFVLALSVAVTFPQAAHAGAKEEARKHYDRAIELVDDAQLAEAVVEFQRSYDLTKHFTVLYNIGQVYVSLAKPVEAIAAYEGYLVGGGKNIPAARRAEVEREVARQKARLATLVFRIIPDGATVRVDGNEVGKSPLGEMLSVGIGEHVVSATADGHEPAEVKVTVAGEDRRTVELTLVALPEKKAEPEPAPVVAPVAPPVLPTTPPPPMVAVAPMPDATVSATSDAPASPRSMTGTQVTGLVAGVAGIAGLVTGTACWFVAQGRHNDAVTTWNQRTNDAKATSLQGQAQDYATAATVSLIAGGALAALGVVLYFVGAPDATSDTHAHLTAAVGPGFAGLNAGGTW
jgi:hypothetical protein